MFKIKMFPALNGDCFWITWGEDRKYNILIDGGQGKACFLELKRKYLDMIADGEMLDLVVVTHIDDDHIMGIKNLFSMREFDSNKIGEIWLNFKNDMEESHVDNDEETNISWQKANQLLKIIKKHNIKQRWVKRGDVKILENAKITVLNPIDYDVENTETDKEEKGEISGKDDYELSFSEIQKKQFETDSSPTNKSSIAFLLEAFDKKILFTGDAFAEDLEKDLKSLGYTKDNRLNLDFYKVSHHGSRHNTNEDLLALINCKNFIISTNKTNSGRPSKECMGRIVLSMGDGISFWFNYNMEEYHIFSSEELEEYDIEVKHEMDIDVEGVINHVQ